MIRRNQYDNSVNSIDLSDCQCPACKQTTLVEQTPSPWPVDQIIDGAVRCRNCSREFDSLWGVPFLGGFGRDNYLGLMEVAASARAYGQIDPSTLKYAQWIELIEEYHQSADGKDEFFERRGVERPSWFFNRYNEHILFHALTADVELNDRDVLDVGAGLGFDSLRYLRRAAKLTAFDSAPPLLRAGSRVAAQARWVGGMTPVLPFADQSFDVVVVNAALHHMHDIPSTIREMLRVLRVGGTLLTMCDSFRSDDAGEDLLLQIFGNDPAVLSGTNEGIPQLREFFDALTPHAEQLEVRAFTVAAYGVFVGGVRRLGSVPQFREWSFNEARKRLKTGSGCIAMRIRKQAAFSTPQPALPPTFIGPGEFSRSLATQEQALTRIAKLTPAEYVDLPLNSRERLRYQMLNGWKPAYDGNSHRSCYNRVCRMMTHPGSGRHLLVEILAPHVPQTDRAELAFCCDGREVARRTIVRGVWTRLAFPWPDGTPGAVQHVQLGLQNLPAGEQARQFSVRRWEIGVPTRERAPTADDLADFGLASLAAVGALPEGRVAVVLSPDYEVARETINRLRQLGRGADVIVEQGQETFFACEPGVTVCGVYPNADLPTERVPAPTVAADLVAARDSAEAEHCVRGLAHRPLWLVTEGGKAQRFVPPAMIPVASRETLQSLRSRTMNLARRVRRGFRRVAATIVG